MPADLPTRIRDMLAELLPCDHAPQDNETLADRGADGIDALTIDLRIEDDFGVRLPDPLDLDMTVGGFVALIETLVASRADRIAL